MIQCIVRPIPMLAIKQELRKETEGQKSSHRIKNRKNYYVIPKLV